MSRNPNGPDAAVNARLIGTFQSAGALSRLLRANAILSVDEIGMSEEENRRSHLLRAELGVKL